MFLGDRGADVNAPNSVLRTTPLMATVGDEAHAAVSGAYSSSGPPRYQILGLVGLISGINFGYKSEVFGRFLSRSCISV
jgi:hypothetical protein